MLGNAVALHIWKKTLFCFSFPVLELERSVEGGGQGVVGRQGLGSA